MNMKSECNIYLIKYIILYLYLVYLNKNHITLNFVFSICKLFNN